MVYERNCTPLFVHKLRTDSKIQKETSLNLTRRLHQCTPELFWAEDTLTLLGKKPEDMSERFPKNIRRNVKEHVACLVKEPVLRVARSCAACFPIKVHRFSNILQAIRPWTHFGLVISAQQGAQLVLQGASGRSLRS